MKSQYIFGLIILSPFSKGCENLLWYVFILIAHQKHHKIANFIFEVTTITSCHKVNKNNIKKGSKTSWQHSSNNVKTVIKKKQQIQEIDQIYVGCCIHLVNDYIHQYHTMWNNRIQNRCWTDGAAGGRWPHHIHIFKYYPPPPNHFDTRNIFYNALSVLRISFQFEQSNTILHTIHFRVSFSIK